MTRLRAACLALFALVVLAPVASADIAGPWPWSRTPPRPSPALVEANRKLIAEGKEPLRVEEPRRTGPFRSCGTGAGLALAGVGTAWGLMWAGRRRADRRASE